MHGSLFGICCGRHRTKKPGIPDLSGSHGEQFSTTEHARGHSWPTKERLAPAAGPTGTLPELRKDYQSRLGQTAIPEYQILVSNGAVNPLCSRALSFDFPGQYPNSHPQCLLSYSSPEAGLPIQALHWVTVEPV